MANSNNKPGPSKSLWREGEHFVWVTGAALATTMLLTFTLVAVVLMNGLGAFWPARLAQLELEDGSNLLGAITQTQTNAQGRVERYQLKVGNRDLYGLDFRWTDASGVKSVSYPEDAVVVERMSYGNFHGYLTAVEHAGRRVEGTEAPGFFDSSWNEVAERATGIVEFDDMLRELSNHQEQLRLEKQRLDYEGKIGRSAEIAVEQGALSSEFEDVIAKRNNLSAELASSVATFRDASGTEKAIPLPEIVRYYQPNAMALSAKLQFYGEKLLELLFAEPREANTEGGLFPAIFGTIVLIFLMSMLSFPLGLMAGIYLREYATDGVMVRTVRIAVNNLAGIPSIVYGIFGLGFFVYGIGGSIDAVFFPERLPSPTFGTGGILWASLTLGLLTVPVVIVATEEALGAIPRGIREGSLALGATKFQTLIRILIPMASPGIMTGFILAMARAAGEVAPLMITGVVKLAPALPVDSSWPFIHLDRKFMHLGFHIYDIGFQSPNVEAAKPMVFVTTLLLVLIVLCMSSVAIHLRNKMKKRYTIGSI